MTSTPPIPLHLIASPAHPETLAVARQLLAAAWPEAVLALTSMDALPAQAALIVLDTHRPDGETIGRIVQAKMIAPRARLAVLVEIADPAGIVAAVKAGADNCFLRDAAGAAALALWEQASVAGLGALSSPVPGLPSGDQDRLLRELQFLHQLSAMMAENLNEDELMRQATELIGRTFHPDIFGILLVDHEREELYLHSSYQPYENHLARNGLREGITGHVATTGRLVRSGDVLADPRFLETHPDIRSELCVPITIRGDVIGVINAERVEYNAYDENDERLLTTIAHQLAMAISKSRLLNSTEDQREELEGLFAASLATSREMAERAGLLRRLALLGSELNRSLSLEEAALAIGRGMLTITEADHACLYGTPYTEAVRRLWGEVLPGFNDEVLLGHLRQKHPAGQMSQPVFIEDIRRLPETNVFRSFGEASNFRAVAAIPLIYEVDMVALVLCTFEQPYAWSANEIEVLNIFGREAAIAFENASSYQVIQRILNETQHRVRELMILFEVSQAMTIAQLRSEEIAQILARQFVDVLKISECSIALYDEDGQSTEVIVDYYIRNGEGFADPEWVGRSLPLQETPSIARVLQSLTPAILHKDDPAVPAQTLAYMREYALEQLAIFPLVYKGKPIGVIELEARQPGQFGESDFQLILTLSNQAAIALENARLYEELEDSYLQTVLALAKAIDAKDSYTGDHSYRLASWAVAIARALGCNREDIRAIQWAAVLHDIGKIGVPDEILLKPGELTQNEWDIMKQHPQFGAEIIAPIKKMAEVTPLIRAHQEKYDGTGYPEGLQGEQIPLGARILAVVDAYSAITDDRVYRGARPRAFAIDELRRFAGTQFDPVVVNTFVEILADEAPSPA